MFDNLVCKIPRHRLVGLVLTLLTLSIAGTPATVAGAATPKLNLQLETASWTSSESAKLQPWINPEGPVQQTVAEVEGPPKESITVTVAKEENIGGSGDYVQYSHRADLIGPKLGVLVHEEDHATRDQHILYGCSVWEEGMARGGERTVMEHLKEKGITEEGYDTNHTYGYEVFYDNDNVPAVGASNCNIYADGGLELLRYEQSGYAFWKIMQECPTFLGQMDAKLFALPVGTPSLVELIGMAAEIQPTVEGEPTAEWIEHQYIFGVQQAPGYYLTMRTNQYTADLYRVGQYGEVEMVPNAQITMKAKGVASGKFYKAEEITTSYGWAGFSPEVPVNAGRLELSLKAKTPEGPVRATFLRSSGVEKGVFGVVEKAKTGTVTFSSPSGQFATFTEPVENGEFAAPALESVRGTAVLEFQGGNRVGRRQIIKDAAPYSVKIPTERVKTN